MGKRTAAEMEMLRRELKCLHDAGTTRKEAGEKLKINQGQISALSKELGLKSWNKKAWPRTNGNTHHGATPFDFRNHKEVQQGGTSARRSPSARLSTAQRRERGIEEKDEYGHGGRMSPIPTDPPELRETFLFLFDEMYEKRFKQLA